MVLPSKCLCLLNIKMDLLLKHLPANIFDFETHFLHLFLRIRLKENDIELINYCCGEVR